MEVVQHRRHHALHAAEDLFGFGGHLRQLGVGGHRRAERWGRARDRVCAAAVSEEWVDGRVQKDTDDAEVWYVENGRKWVVAVKCTTTLRWRLAILQLTKDDVTVGVMRRATDTTVNLYRYMFVKAPDSQHQD